jgi:hypothetical protein
MEQPVGERERQRREEFGDGSGRRDGRAYLISLTPPRIAI